MFYNTGQAIFIVLVLAAEEIRIIRDAL